MSGASLEARAQLDSELDRARGAAAAAEADLDSRVTVCASTVLRGLRARLSCQRSLKFKMISSFSAYLTSKQKKLTE